MQGAALYVAHGQSVGLYINLYTIKERFVKLEISDVGGECIRETIYAVIAFWCGGHNYLQK